MATARRVSFCFFCNVHLNFKEHRFNISRDILDWVLNCFSGTTYDVITYDTKTGISLKRKKVFQKGKCHSSLLWKAFEISSNYFLLHRHFKEKLSEIGGHLRVREIQSYKSKHVKYPMQFIILNSTYVIESFRCFALITFIAIPDRFKC